MSSAAISTNDIRTHDIRIAAFEPLPSPGELRERLPLGARRAALVAESRAGIARILAGEDDRLLVVVGPCSVHDPAAALAYARRLAAVAARHAERMLVVMRVYFEKPRTTDGWKGLINDPHLDGSHRVAEGLAIARRLLLDILDAGMPVAGEFLEPTTPQYIADAVSYGAIGARTTESQVHRQLASGLSMPVGFKNGTDGDVQVAVDGCIAASRPQTFLGTDEAGRAAVISTLGNPAAHVILRGGRGGPNFGAAQVADAAALLARAGRPPRLVVDASHANSGKSPQRQREVVRLLTERIAAGAAGGATSIAGVMIESFLVAGRQEPRPGVPLVFGQSITDACLGWEDTVALLEGLAGASACRSTPLVGV
ncbi:MAG: 3-deoxy-7-phosphoheptulonate synthase [Microbacteriaceae bacterium]